MAVSGLKVNRLDMYGEKYKPFKGVKYITKAGKFQIRMWINSKIFVIQKRLIQRSVYYCAILSLIWKRIINEIMVFQNNYVLWTILKEGCHFHGIPISIIIVYSYADFI